MQKAILAKNGSSVINKMVYSGGGATFDTFMTDELTRLELQYPSYAFTLYSSDTDSAFAAAVVDSYIEII